MKKIQIVLLILLATITFIARAQKLPNVQQTGIRAPDNIKIDGRAIEWDNQFQAYNKATEVFYTVSNDDENLYLTIQAIDPDIINKLYAGGITFSINLLGEKSDKNVINVTYPIFDKDDRFHVNIKSKPVIIQNSQLSIIKADSFMNANNKLMISKAKWIKINGIKGMDTLISVYNEYNIKATGLFDNKMIYTIELGIPLKILGLSINTNVKFAYHIILNQMPQGGGDNVVREQRMSSNGTMVTTIHLSKNDIDIGKTMSLMSTTDFWGEYTLAKK